LKAQVNVRAGPGTEYSSLGLLDPGQKVQIVGKDQSGKWYVILYPGGPQERGWVTASYIQAGNTGGLPVVMGADARGSPSAATGKVTQQLNVRAGPGTGYDLLGRLQPGAVVTLTGKNETGTWLQIEYTGGPGGRGWVTAGYLQISSAAGLPVLNASGTPFPVEPSAGMPAPAVTLTPTVGPAPADGDSSANPAFRVTFSPSGTRQFSYTGNVSAPEGDAEDWVEFTPYAAPGETTAALTTSLLCTGNGALDVELWQNGAPLAGWGALACGDVERVLPLVAGTTYQLRLSIVTANGLQYTQYTLTLRSNP
jgi:uncharacterized protein YraI